MENVSLKKVLSKLPQSMAMEIKTIINGRLFGEEALGEIRIIADGKCSIVHNREALRLSYSPTASEVEAILSDLCSGGTYAFRDTIKQGFISIGKGVRVGVSGTARYDGGELIGISEPKTLVFRFPLAKCDFEDKLYRIYKKGIGNGMLIYSPPAIGKTTALRALAEKISKEKRLCIIDERGEFDSDRLPFASVLSGYEKALGIEIALRTHSPEMIMIDELGMSECQALLSVLSAGVPVIATAHGNSIEGLMSKPSVSPLIEAGIFSVFVGIERNKRGYRLIRNEYTEIFQREKQVSDRCYEN